MWQYTLQGLKTKDWELKLNQNKRIFKLEMHLDKCKQDKTSQKSTFLNLDYFKILDMSEWTGVSMLVSRNPEIQEMDIGKSKVKFYL